jgi:hypothetical protein
MTDVSVSSWPHLIVPPDMRQTWANGTLTSFPGVCPGLGVAEKDDDVVLFDELVGVRRDRFVGPAHDRITQSR